MNRARALAGVGRGFLFGQGAAAEAVDDGCFARQDNTRGADAPRPARRRMFTPQSADESKKHPDRRWSYEHYPLLSMLGYGAAMSGRTYSRNSRLTSDRVD